MTHTLATLELSAEAYDEIAGVLHKTGYHKSLITCGVIDMNGIGIVRGEPSNDVADNLAKEIAGAKYT